MNTYPFSPKLRPTLWDGAVAALVATLAIVTALCFYGRRTGAPQTVTITHRGALVQTIRLTGLTETKTVAIDGDYHLEIQVDSGGVCVTRSDCPGQDPLRPEHRLPAGAGGHPTHRRHIGRRCGVGIGGGA